VPSVKAFQAAVHPDDLPLVRESERQAEQTGHHDVVHRIVRPDGSVRHVHELAQAETDATGNLVGLTGTVQDITERVEAEQALIAAREEADRASQTKSEFLSSMSHELRTPMNAILGFGQLMEYDDTLPEEHKDSVQEILKAGHHLLELINEVLDLAKVESGHIDMSLEAVNVCAIVKECLNLVGTLAEKRNIQLSHSGLDGAAVRADCTRLRQVLLNLLSNAIKYNREGGSVHLNIRPRGTDRLRILVTDTGPGIPAARQMELFQPFNRLDAENSGIEGTGIGLTITRRIVEMMGGTVDVESEVGVGSTFWIELPLESMPGGTHNHDHKVAANGTMPTQHVETAQHTVLYIEDNPSNLRLVTQILGHRQHIHLLTAHTPEMGIELALARRPELILLDINMPGMDGYQVLEVFKAEARLKTIPVIAITANAMPRDIARGMEAGFCAYVTKPIDIADFFSILDRYLSDRTENQA
jgi:signal transduction histidine kinase/ActR/RegA family two-component response regulator